MKQAELGRRFEAGETNGKASNVEIMSLTDGTTALVGYGWAIYAHRKTNGHITVYGWRGYSMSTSCQYSRMGLEAMADETSDERPQVFKHKGGRATEIPAE